MILDHKFLPKRGLLSISYINELGAKEVLRFNRTKFRTYVFEQDDTNNTKKYINWDSRTCLETFTDNPTWFDILTFIEELPESQKSKLTGKTNPRLYTWDIEVEIDGENFPEPSVAEYPVTNISIVNDRLDCVVLGTRPLNGNPEGIRKNIQSHLNTCKYYKSLGLKPGKFIYIKFDSEEEMLKYFLVNVVKKAPVLAGWNSELFDWYYITTRIQNNYPNISIMSASQTYSCSTKYKRDKKDNKIYLSVPDHTLMVDYMGLVENFDYTLGIKESLSLDYIANETIGLGKIKYSGDLRRLYETDYDKYVFYNSIDSILVQLIDKKLKTLSNLCAQAQFCGIKIGSCFSKIAITEAMFFHYFFEHGLKIVPFKPDNRTRGELIGAYVKQPTPGKYNYVCCNDFASLYPSVIQTLNCSVENYLGSVNDGTFNESELEKYRQDPNYTVSINGSVYKNDKNYAFREIQASLRSNRNGAKYLAKQLSAHVLSDVDHMLEGRTIADPKEYGDHETIKLAELGYPGMKTSYDLVKIDDLGMFRIKLISEIDWLTAFEQANKYVMNSMYGGSSHIAFFWFNMDLANDITSEGRNLIHMMEEHIPKYVSENWSSMIAPKLGYKLKPQSQWNPEKLCISVYCDTDSDYLCYEGLLKSIEGEEKMSVEDKRDILVRFNTKFLNQHNKEFIDSYYKTRNCESVHEFELETINLSGIWLDVKKKYAQILLWKDGKIFDPDERPLKVKGMEIIKSSYPSLSRKRLKDVIRYMLETSESGNVLTHKLNKKVQQIKSEWMGADIEDVCENKNINGYSKYVVSDDDRTGPKTGSGCPYSVRALANRNWCINTKLDCRGDLQYGGKYKIYIVKPIGSRGGSNRTESYFAFGSGEYPDWASKYFPIDRKACFKKYFLDPFNRILGAIGMQKLQVDGYIDIGLFD